MKPQEVHLYVTIWLHLPYTDVIMYVFWTNNLRAWDVHLKKSESAEVRAVVSENSFNPQVSLKTANVEVQLHESLGQTDRSEALLLLLGPELERSEENLLHSVEELLVSEDYFNGPSRKQFVGQFFTKSESDFALGSAIFYCRIFFLF